MKIYSAEVLNEINEILNIGIALSAQKDHNQLLEMIVKEAREITGADGGTLYLHDGEYLQFKIIQNESMNIFQGGNGEAIDLPPVPLIPDNVCSYAALTQVSINIPDVYQAEGFDFSGPARYDKLTGYRTVSMLVIPLKNHEDQIIGVLQLINARNSEGQVIPFASYYEKVITSLASQAAISLTNMQLLANIEQLFHSLVEVLATAIDSRTPYNANHTRRVAYLAAELAKGINESSEGKWGRDYFDEERLAQLVMAGWLHDIGKIVTPLAVMNKSTRLEGKVDLVMQRLDYIASCLENEYLRKKISLYPSPDQTLPDLDQWYKDEMAAVQEARELILAADNPSTYIDAPILSSLKEIAARSYRNFSGQKCAWLSEEELNALSVAKGTLTKDERQIMEDHVRITRQLLDKIPFHGKLKDVPFFASIHHEFLNGQGYPQGLKADKIPLEGRILALVDIFDALTAADRPYKKAIPVDKALNILEFMVKDGQLDGDLLQVFRKSRAWEGLAPLNDQLSGDLTLDAREK